MATASSYSKLLEFKYPRRHRTGSGVSEISTMTICKILKNSLTNIAKHLNERPGGDSTPICIQVESNMPKEKWWFIQTPL